MNFDPFPRLWKDRIPSPLIQLCNGKVQYANAAAQTLFRSRNNENVLDAILAKETLMPLFLSSLKQNDAATLYMEMENKYFLVTPCPGDTPETYILLFDPLSSTPSGLAEKDDGLAPFMSALGSELRAPLSIVFPTLDLLAVSLPQNDKKSHEYLSSLRHYFFKMLRRIRNLTDLPLLLQGQTQLLIKPHDIVSFLRQTAEDLQPYIETEKITLQFSAAIDSAILFFDSEKLGRALLNLFAFALKRLSGEGKIRFFLEDCDTHILICMQDTGPSLAEEDMIRALDFYRQFNRDIDGLAKKPAELELCIVRAIVELHNGSFLLTSHEQKGVAATISLSKQEPSIPLVLKSPAADAWSGFAPQLVELSDAVPTGIAPYMFPEKS